MRHKFLGIGEPGYHPLRKLRTVFSGLRYAVVYDFSVAYKLILSTLVLAAAFVLRAWVDFLLILVVTAFVPLALIGAAALAHLAKLAIERPRPDLLPALVAMPADPSFPSAHAMQATAFAVAWLLRPGARPGAAEAVAALLLAAAVAGSRVYLQVHFVSDVAFGVIAAILWVLALRCLPVWTPRLR